MKNGLHPKTGVLLANCVCGASHQIAHSTLIGPFSIEICSLCHPHYTGQQKTVDTAGRVDKFKKKLAAAQKPNTASEK